MSQKDYYSVLGVSRDASESELKSAFRKLARQHHPDVNKDKGSQDKFKEINEAYQVLSDPQKRQHYDRFGSAEGFDFQGAGGAGGFGDIFSHFGGMGDILENFGFGDMFGGARQSGGSRAGGGKRKGEDIRVDQTLTLEEAAHGVEKEIHVRNLDKCSDCNGTGSRSKKAATTCTTCAGRGEVRQSRQSILGTISTVTPCPHCHGEGQTISDPCPTCSGAGRCARSRNIKVKIPAGIDSGSRLRVSGEGNMGQRGGEQGDLYVYIEIKRHPVYEREGDNLSSKQPILFTQAALGDEIDVKTIFGNVSLKIPAGTQPGTVFRLKGKGMPHLHSHGHGDLFVSVVIEIPKHLSAEEKTVLEYFSKIRKEDTAFSKSSDIITRLKKMLGK